jgi:transcriptional regulator with XRE-family HTH domain
VSACLPTARATLAAGLDERGVTQQEIADECGASQAAVSRYVRGDVTVEPPLDAAREAGNESTAFGASYEDRQHRLRKAFTERGSVLRTISRGGAFGIEPTTDVFGETATEATARSIDLRGRSGVSS